MSLRSRRGWGLVAGGWFAIAPALMAQAPPGQMPTLPLTQLDERGPAADLDNRALTLSFAQPVAVKDLLLLIVRGTTLSIVPDPALSGSFIGELRNVTVRQALELVLAPLGFDYRADGGLVRVFPRALATRIFDVNYVATDRVGASTTGGDLGAPGTTASSSVSSATRTDLFADLAKGVQGLLSERATFNLDRKAGLLQVTDFPERLDRVAEYLDAVQDHVHRQVEIDARVVEVELTDETAQTLDWDALALAAAGGGQSEPGARAERAGLRVTDAAAFLTALGTQGRVSVVANPRLLALNNEPAIVRAVAAEVPQRDGAGSVAIEGFVMSVTPQISADGVVMLSLSPIVATRTTANESQGVARRAIHEADTLARVASGETLVISGFTRDRAVPARSGWFGRNTAATRARVAVLILLTPRIVP